jgi:hypothetical protein
MAGRVSQKLIHYLFLSQLNDGFFLFLFLGQCLIAGLHPVIFLPQPPELHHHAWFSNDILSQFAQCMMCVVTVMCTLLLRSHFDPGSCFPHYFP